MSTRLPVKRLYNPAMTSQLTIRPERPFPYRHVALLEAAGLCLPGGLLVFSVLSRDWSTAVVACFLLLWLAWWEWRTWGRTGVTIHSGTIRVSSPYGVRRDIAAEEVDRLLRAGTNVYFLSRTGARLGAFPSGVFTNAELERLASHLGVEC